MTCDIFVVLNIDWRHCFFEAKSTDKSGALCQGHCGQSLPFGDSLDGQDLEHIVTVFQANFVRIFFEVMVVSKNQTSFQYESGPTACCLCDMFVDAFNVVLCSVCAI